MRQSLPWCDFDSDIRSARRNALLQKKDADALKNISLRFQEGAQGRDRPRVPERPSLRLLRRGRQGAREGGGGHRGAAAGEGGAPHLPEAREGPLHEDGPEAGGGAMRVQEEDQVRRFLSFCVCCFFYKISNEDEGRSVTIGTLIKHSYISVKAHCLRR